MRISTKSRYGTRLLLDLALSGEELTPLKDIAARQDLSVQYLENLIAPLIAARIVRSIRGPKGGISLARNPCDIRMNEVIDALEGTLAVTDCIDSPEICLRSELCVTRELWQELKQKMYEVLDKMSLQDLVDRHRAIETLVAAR